MVDRRVVRFLDAWAPDTNSGPLLVGVSGGADSVCLLIALAGLRGTSTLELHAAHLNHGLRGAESDADAAYVERLCASLAVPLVLDSADVEGYRKRRRLSLEEAGRNARYGFFAATAKRVGARAVALGHTADDQVETVLMHILRGSGLAGLRGMEPVSRWRVRGGEDLVLLRPLLETRRSETEEYCEVLKLDPCTDSTNESPEFLRNRLRQELVPLLRGYNPRVDEGILRLAAAAGEADDYLRQEAARAWRRIGRMESGEALIDAAGFGRLPPALQVEVLRTALSQLRGDLRGIEATHLQKMVELVAGAAGRSVDLPGRLSFVAGYERHQIGPRRAAAPRVLKRKRRLNVPGVTELPGWRVDARLVPVKGADLQASGYVVHLAPGVASDGLWAAARRDGDRFRPLGLGGAKKLQDYMVDSKVPRDMRAGIPIVWDSRDILWVVGYRIAEKARVPEDADEALRIEFTPKG
jgi:tRNA(Ile)-lysidine synthase